MKTCRLRAVIPDVGFSLIEPGYNCGYSMKKCGVMTDYFAYGSNMDPRQMEFRCPGAIPVGTAVLDNFRFVINSQGVATIEEDEACKVCGVVWDISVEHESTLDGYEGVWKGMYYKTTVPVLTPGGEKIEALVYINPLVETGPPREGYLEKIVYGAGHFRLPEEYIEELRSWSRSVEK